MIKIYSALIATLCLYCCLQNCEAQNQGYYNRYGQWTPGSTTGQGVQSEGYYNRYGQWTPGAGQAPMPYYGPGTGGYYGHYPYVTQPGYGYYPGSPYSPGFPALGAPVPISGGFFRFNVGGFSGAYWKSPSGYYYPWGAGAVYTTPPPIIYIQQGNSAPAQPPVTDMMKDMYSYIEEQNGKKKFKPEDYQHLSRRLRDIQTMEASYRSRNGGVLDQADEESIRKDLSMLSGDISRRVIP